MGDFQHHAIVVTAFSSSDAEKIATNATALGCTIAGPTASPVNGFTTLCVVPDGSKEHWPDSARGDEQRAAFIRYLESKDRPTVVSWVEFEYGDYGVRIIATNRENDTAVPWRVGI